MQRFEFPSLAGQGMISVDLETCDPDLKTRGPGPHRGGFIAGVAIGTAAGFRAYLPVGHEGGPNMDRRKVLRWLQEQMLLPVPKVGAKLSYDLMFMLAAGIRSVGPYYDVQVAESLLDENKFVYSLESIAKQYLGVGKLGEEMDAWLVEHFGKKNPRNSIWRAPPEVVAPYAVSDVDLPLRILKIQEPELRKQDLWDLFLLESRLTPALVEMHACGVRVDLAAAEEMERSMGGDQAKLQKQMKRQVGFDVEVWAAKSLAKAFDELGLEYPRTKKTNAPSFLAPWLDAHPHPFANKVRRVRWLDKMRGTFLRGCILEGHHNGRVHTQFNQLKSEEGGTVTGRLSSKQPNLQFIPVRTDEGKLLRAMFLPEEGTRWAKLDYSQIEYRLIVHDAACLDLKGAPEVVDRYHNEAGVDFHQVVADMTGLSRQSAKTINFGLAYGEGRVKLAGQLGLTLDEADTLLRTYHSRAPFIRPLADFCMRSASRVGEVRTLLNRKRRFLWGKENRDGTFFLSSKRFHGAQRMFTHKALNARVQGSAADIMKKAMVEVYEDSQCRKEAVLHLTVHDELDISVAPTKKGSAVAQRVKEIMEDTVQLKVPLEVDLEFGANWGQTEKAPRGPDVPSGGRGGGWSDK